MEQMIDIGTHSLHIRCVGEGKPTIVIDTGLGDVAQNWYGIQNRLAKESRVCTYDRAGYGPSEPGPLPRHCGREADELKALLDGASVRSPYVVVGHSLGGLNMQAFAATYQEDVIGVVLLDPPPLSFMRGEEYTDLLAPAEQMTAEWQASADFGASSTDPQERSQAAFLQMIASEHREAFGGKSAELVSALSSFGDIPLLVIAAGKPNPFFGDLAEEYQQYWIEQSRALSYKSSNGRLVLAEESTHHLYKDVPDLVIESILSIVYQARRER